MKRTLLFFCTIIFFVFTCFNRYTPIDLKLAKPTLMEVEIKGAISNPGVYTLKRNSSISTLIKRSGPLLENADTSRIKLISLNSATKEELQTLPGIGPSIAQRIIDYRESSTFQTLEQIKDVKGIGEALFNRIKDKICL